MIQGTVETKKTYELSKKEVEQLILGALGLKGSPGASVYFNCRGGDDGYGGYDPITLESVQVVSTVREMLNPVPYP